MFIVYRSVTNKTWRTINETLNRNKKSSNVPSPFYDNGRTLSNMIEIANAFNVYFANIGEKLASEIEENVNNIADYTNYISVLPSIEEDFSSNALQMVIHDWLLTSWKIKPVQVMMEFLTNC